MGFSADFGKLVKIPGLSAYAGISWGTGSNLSASLDSAIPTSTLYAPSFYLGEMYLQQKLLHQKLTILAGRLAASDGFAALPVFTNYVTYGINPNPFSLGANDIAFSGPPPGTEWGAQASYTVTKTIQVSAGVFNTNSNSANGESHGADFTLQEGNKGILAIGEIDYLRNQSADSVGKPGQIAAGFLHSNNSFPYLNNPLGHNDGYSGVYLLGQQMVFRPDGPGTSRGATIWGAWTFNSKDLVSRIPSFWGAGLSYEGLIKKRKRDIVSAGYIYGKTSRYIPNASAAKLFEANYQWVAKRYVIVVPDFQYIWDTTGTNGTGALVLGVQVNLTF